MLSIELPPDVASKLEDISESQNISPSEIVHQLIRQYLDAYFDRTTAYELGKDLFGRYGRRDENASPFDRKESS